MTLESLKQNCDILHDKKLILKTENLDKTLELTSLNPLNV